MNPARAALCPLGRLYRAISLFVLGSCHVKVQLATKYVEGGITLLAQSFCWLSASERPNKDFPTRKWGNFPRIGHQKSPNAEPKY
jgi:hypothetical protein